MMKFPKPQKRKRNGLSPKQQLEKLQSLYVRARGGWQCEIHRECERRGIIAHCVCHGHLSKCHLINAKDSNAYKFDLRNMRAGCSSFNAWANFHNVEWLALWQHLFPEAVPLLATAKVPVKRTEADLRFMIADLQNNLLPLVLESSQMEKLRECDFNVRKFLKGIIE